jgi:signal transduction histidine kinase
MPNNDNNIPSAEEYKKITEELYKRNLELARLYKEVDALNKQRESLMHLITHKVKGSFTHSKYIFAGILDGTFGEINEEVKRRAEQGLESNDGGIKTIDLVLNSENLQKGIIKYDMKKVNFRDVVLNAWSEKKVAFEKRGLALENIIKKDTYMVNGDAFWLKESISNLLENSLRYTKEGKVTIDIQDTEDNKIIFSIKDTGIGINEEDKKNLFTEGGRGKDSVKVNVDSTGYGLYSVRLVVEAHGGRVWAESEGLNKGSTFYIELNKAK